MTVTVFGLGFVGLTTALGFAEKGHKVYGIDINKERADSIASGRLPFMELGLDDALLRHIDNGFIVVRELSAAISESDCIFYCVGTPYGKNGEADLTYLYAALDSTLDVINDDKFRVLTVKSTVPPSTAAERVTPFVNERKNAIANIAVANNPEFLREGYCWSDFMNADRIVIGVNESQSEKVLKGLYSGFDVPVIAVSLNTAEFIKYLSNTLLATMISYSNEMAETAYKIGGIQIAEAFKVLHMDKRWGGCNMTSYVYPGCGYGGYCLPKDTNALASLMEGRGFSMPILKAVINMNDQMPNAICDRITQDFNKDANIGILGLSFKPGSDDVRDTPAAKVISGLISSGYNNISVYDPVAAEDFRRHYELPISYCSSLEDISQKADILVILTAWPEFKNIKDIGKKLIDCRYML